MLNSKGDVNGNVQRLGEKTSKQITKSDKKFVHLKNYLKVPTYVINILETAAKESNIPPVASTSGQSTPRHEQRFQSAQPKDLLENQSRTLPTKETCTKPKGLAEMRLKKIQADNLQERMKRMVRNKMPREEECALPPRLVRSVLPEEGKCLCQRPIRLLLCRFCGFYCKGNIKAVCQLHPKTIYLNAIDTCANCKALNLLIEFNLD